MSVYTAIEHDELERFLATFPVGKLVAYQGISAGIENTNYFVNTTERSLVLTIFESLEASDVPFFLDLMAHLAEHGVPCPHPVPDGGGQYLHRIKGKPAALVNCLPGSSIDQPDADDCAAVGRELARLHLAGQSFTRQRPNSRGPRWWRDTARVVMPYLTAEDAELLRAELYHQSLFRLNDLPRGIIHGDLFRDNALFDTEGVLTGIIDFYYACHDVLLFDVAVTINDWCSDSTGELDPSLASALLHAYSNERPFTAIERGAWTVLLRSAALRFWLSRLYDQNFPRPGPMTHIKDPTVFKRVLLARIEAGNSLRDLLP